MVQASALPDCIRRASLSHGRGSAAQCAWILLAAVWLVGCSRSSNSTGPNRQQDTTGGDRSSGTVSVDKDPSALTSGATELDQAKQKRIWDAEHITFKIEKRFGPLFKDAWVARDPRALAGLLRDDFRGEIINRPGAGDSATLRTKSVLSEQRITAAQSTTKPADAQTFIDSLLGTLVDFELIEKVNLRVLKIRRLESNFGNRWSTELLLTAFGRDTAGRLLAHDSHHRVEFFYDKEDEIDQGQVVASWNVADERLRTSARMLLEEVTAQLGLDKLPLRDNWHTEERPQQFRFQMAVEDYDRDGFLDIAIASSRGFPVLLHSDKGQRFDDVAGIAGLKSWNPFEYRYLATWVDYDNDGFPDLLMGSRLYHNVQGERFDDVTEKAGLQINQRPMGCAVADYDGDGLLDLYVLYQFSNEQKPREGPIPWVGDDTTGQQNQLWRNQGDGTFANVTDASGTAGGLRNSFAATWLYADDDALPDLYVANDFGTNVMLRNRGDGTFEDISDAKRVSDYATSMGVAAGDVNNDGVPELYVANMYSKMGRRIIAHVDANDYAPGIYEQIKGACAGNRLYRLDADSGTYQDLSTSLGVNGIGWAFAPAMVDLNNDGWLDMYATTGFMSFNRKKPDG